MSTITSTKIPTGTWNVDPTHSEVGFAVPYLGGTFRGSFSPVEATLTVAEDGAVELAGSAPVEGRSAGTSGVLSRLSSVFVAAETGGAASVRLGQRLVRLLYGAEYDIGPKATRVINGRTRIFDGLNDEAVSEVKNVQQLSNTQQLRDYAEYASENGLRLDIYVRGNTQISGPLARLDLDPNSPVIIIRALP